MMLMKQRLEKQISTLEREITQGPEGTLVYHNSGGKCRYYMQTCKNGVKKRTYLKDEDFRTKSQLLKKKIRMLLLRDCKNELEAVEAYLKIRKDYPLTTVYDCAPMYNLLMQTCEEWQKADYAKNPYHPEELTIEGADGVMVASKSERDITYGLKDAALANHYEQKRTLGNRDVYPDFTIFNPINGRLMIWEHFGKMDDDDYARHTYEKIELYKKHGYFPGDNLIMTFEDKSHPLTQEEIQKTIQKYFGEWLAVRAREGKE